MSVVDESSDREHPSPLQALSLPSIALDCARPRSCHSNRLALHCIAYPGSYLSGPRGEAGRHGPGFHEDQPGRFGVSLANALGGYPPTKCWIEARILKSRSRL
jgi:hypothetical protein